jgi:sterol desaturase/sphingolipid hydroxylase (fatty acid hydroxylase superfamily)
MKRINSPFLTMPLWSAVGAVMVASSPRPWVGILGAASWPFVEYVAHRWAMHGLSRWAPRFYKRVHGVHHLYPRDLSHFVIPAPVVAAVACVLATPLLASGVGLAPLGGLLLAFVLYDLAHLAAHGFAPFPFASALARHHAQHHVNETANYGVTTPCLDYLLGTRESPSSS